MAGIFRPLHTHPGPLYQNWKQYTEKFMKLKRICEQGLNSPVNFLPYALNLDKFYNK